MPQGEDPVVRSAAELLSARDLTLAIAESLTGGELSARFACAHAASGWYRGAVVAYASGVKREVLDVPLGPVVSEAAARAMAENVAKRLGADVGLAVTGVAGPDAQDGQPPGTVWMALHTAEQTQARLARYGGEPDEVLEATMREASTWLLEELRASA
jgi:nicotinamide-nucleotide amidase